MGLESGFGGGKSGLCDNDHSIEHVPNVCHKKQNPIHLYVEPQNTSEHAFDTLKSRFLWARKSTFWVEIRILSQRSTFAEVKTRFSPPKNRIYGFKNHLPRSDFLDRKIKFLGPKIVFLDQNHNRLVRRRTD